MRKSGGAMILSAFLLSAGVSLSAETASAPAIPAALVLEVVTAPGYSFMDGCADPKMMSAPAQSSSRPAPAAGASDEVDHTAHHPGGSAPIPAAGAAGIGDREAALAELNRSAAQFGAYRSGTPDVNVKN